MNFVQTMKLFSVQALFRTATLTVIGASAFLAAPAHAGLIYSTNFSSITPTGAASGALSGTQLTNVGSGNIYYQTNFTYPTGTGGGSAATAALSTFNGDVYAYQFSGSGPTVPGDVTGGSNNDYGVLLNSTCAFTCGNTTSPSIGAIQLSLTGLTPNQPDVLTVEYWGDVPNTTSASLGLTISATGNAAQTFLTSAPNGTYETALYYFTAPSNGNVVITLADNDSVSGLAGNPAPIIGDITVGGPVPEPASGLLLLAPAAFFFIRRKIVKK